MTVKRPSKEDIVELADYYGMHFSDLEVGEYQQLLADACGSYDRIDELEVLNWYLPQ